MTRREIRLWGLGGQGIITAGHIIGQAALLFDKKDAIMTEDYSPYITGGWSKADVVVSDEPIDYPLILKPDVLVAMSQEAFDLGWKKLKENGLIVIEKDMVNPEKSEGVRVVKVPAVALAEGLGRKVVANIAMLGAVTTLSNIVSPDAVKEAIKRRFPKAAELNMKAFQQGADSVKGEV